MNKKPIGVGIVGLGFMGRTHLGAYAACANDPASARVLALCDPHMRPASAGNLVTAGGNDAMLKSIPHEPSFDALLARPDIELVSICTPTDSPVKLARAAIAAGKHVLIEKPTALDPDEIEALHSRQPLADHVTRYALAALGLGPPLATSKPVHSVKDSL